MKDKRTIVDMFAQREEYSRVGQNYKAVCCTLGVLSELQLISNKCDEKTKELTTTILELHDNRIVDDYLPTLRDLLQHESVRFAVSIRSRSPLSVLNQLIKLAFRFPKLPIDKYGTSNGALMTAYKISVDPSAKDPMIDLLSDKSLAIAIWDCVCRLSRIVHLHEVILHAVGQFSNFAPLGFVVLRPIATNPSHRPQVR
jgi:hypothetical protein